MRTTPQPAQRKKVTAKPAVKNSVSKLCAASLHDLFTEGAPELNRLFTDLFTIMGAHEQELKSQAARDRLAECQETLIDCLKYGWHFGITGHATPSMRSRIRTTCRRTKALAKLAIQAGLNVGRTQREAVAERKHLRP